MFLNKGIQHSVRIIGYLIQRNDNQNVNAYLISESLNLPTEYTSKILQTLAKNGIVTSSKGRGGGFKIKKSPNDILLGDIIDIFNLRPFLSTCFLKLYGECRQSYCPMHLSWFEYKKKIYNKRISELHVT